MKITENKQPIEARLSTITEGSVFYYNFDIDPNFYIRGVQQEDDGYIQATHLSTGEHFTFCPDTEVISCDAELIVRRK